MSVTKKDLYRGRHKWRSILATCVSVFALIIFLCVGLFYFFQRYIEYSSDGIYLDLPFRTDTRAPAISINPDKPYVSSGVVAEIVVDSPDYSELDIGAGEDLSELKALYIPSSKVNSTSLTEALQAMRSGGMNGLIIEMKPASGVLPWNSQVSLATSYGASGAKEDLAASIKMLKDGGAYLVAELSCFADSLMATRNAPIALRDEFGTPYSDAAGGWLDPYNKTVRTYITDLAKELYEMGFDEVLLSNLRLPITDGGFTYSQMISAEDPVGCVSNFAYGVVKGLRDTQMRVSVLCDNNSFRNGLEAQTGQKLSDLDNICDRLYSYSSADMAESDFSVFSGLLGSETAARYVMVSTGSSTTGSYATIY